MSEKKPERIHMMKDFLALVDSDHYVAAKIAEATFHHDVGVAIATIEQVTMLSSARVTTDMQVASAKIQVDAEVAASRLMTDAQMAIKRYKNIFETQDGENPIGKAENSLKAIENSYIASASEQTRNLIESLERDAQIAIAKIKALGTEAINQITELVEDVAGAVDGNASLAAEKLQAFHLEEHTLEEAASEAERAAVLVEKTATEASKKLKSSLKEAVDNIQMTTDEACLKIKIAVASSTERILLAKESSLAMFRTIVDSYGIH